MTFEAPDEERFPAIPIARAAGQAGPGATAALIAADDIAVERFLMGELSYPGMARLVESAITRFSVPHAPALEELLPVMRRAGLMMTDVQNLRLHYARTLQHWLAAFEAHLDDVRAMFDDSFIRMWRFYLAGSVAGFKYNSVQLYQVLFTNGPSSDLALGRGHHEPVSAAGVPDDTPTEDIPTWIDTM